MWLETGLGGFDDPARRDVRRVVGEDGRDLALLEQEGRGFCHGLRRTATEQIGTGLLFQRREVVAL